MNRFPDQQPYAFAQQEFDFLIEWKKVSQLLEALQAGKSDEIVFQVQEEMRRTGRAHALIELGMRRPKRGERRLPDALREKVSIREQPFGDPSLIAATAYNPIEIVDFTTGIKSWRYQQVAMRPTLDGGVNISHEWITVANGVITEAREDFKKPLSSHVNNPHFVRSVVDQICQQFPVV